MKKISYLFLFMFLIISLLGCNKESEEMTTLKTPVVSISEDGLASWGKVKYAEGYAYKINGGKAIETTELEVQLEYGDSIRVKALGDGELYEDSSYSKTMIFGNEVETEPIEPTIPDDKTPIETPTPVGVNYYDGYSDIFDINNYWQVSSANGIDIKYQYSGVRFDYSKTAKYQNVYTLVDGDFTKFNTLTIKISGTAQHFLLQVEGKDVSRSMNFNLDGSEQIFRFDLSMLSQYERENIEKVVLYPAPGENASGWFEISQLNFNDNVVEDLTPTPDGEVIIKYSTWSHNPELELLVQRFNDTHNDIKIEIVPYGESADIFDVNSVADEIMGGSVLDLSKFVYSDYEWSLVGNELRDSITYNGQVFALPKSQYYLGYFANTSLIERYYGYTDFYNLSVEEFANIIRKVTDVDRFDGTGRIGINSVGDMINWMPSVLDYTGSIKHFLWNYSTNKIDYRSEAAYNTFAYSQDLYNYSLDYLFANSLYIDEIFGASDTYSIFRNGRMAFYSGATWDNFDDVDFDCHFIGYPGKKVISAVDYICVSRHTNYPSYAYEVAKYLSYGIDGNKEKMNVVEENGLSLQGLPVTVEDGIVSRWFSFNNMGIYKDIYHQVLNGEKEVLVELNKSLPGYIEVRFNANTELSYYDIRGGAELSIGDFIWDTTTGAISLNTYKNDMSVALSDKLNSIFEKSNNELYDKIGGPQIDDLDSIFVNFDLNGGSGFVTQYKLDQYSELDFDNLSIPVRDGYEFIGWSISPYGNVDFNVDSIYNYWDFINHTYGNTLTLYAVWEEKFNYRDFINIYDGYSDYFDVNMNWYSHDNGEYEVLSDIAPYNVLYNKTSNWSYLTTNISNVGSFDRLEFTLSVPYGVEYIVKVEGLDVYEELQLVGTGDFESNSLDLRKYSVEQRNSISKVLIFMDYEDTYSTGKFEILDMKFTFEDIAVRYAGTYNGVATFDDVTGTYSFTVQLELWDRVRIVYNNDLLSMDELNVNGAFTYSNNAPWTPELFCATSDESSTEVDWTALISSCGNPVEYTFIYNPNEQSLHINAKEIIPGLPEVPEYGFYVEVFESNKGFAESTHVFESVNGVYTGQGTLNQWWRVRFYYDGNPLSIDNLNITGDFEGYNPSNKALYSDFDNETVYDLLCDYRSDYGVLYTFRYNPETNTLDVQDDEGEKYIPTDGIYYEYTNSYAELEPLQKVEANADGSYKIVLDLAAWRYVQIYYNGVVVDSEDENVEVTLTGAFYVDNLGSPTSRFYVYEAGKYQVVYTPATANSNAMLVASKYQE